MLVSASLILAGCFATLDGGIAAQIQRQIRNIGIGDRAFRPVTDAMLEKPDPGDWINWRRTYDGTGYSPRHRSPDRTWTSSSSHGRGACRQARISRRRSCTTG